jgi:O-antigen/teichoic acid export membrane protein
VRFFAWNWDDWFVGRQLGTTELGYYNRAFEFTNSTIHQFGMKVVGGVLFPAYANVKSNLERLQRAYIKSVRLVSMMVFPIGLGLLATASLLIPVVLGNQWMPMVTTFQIFSVMVLTRPISANTSSVYQALGKPEYNTYAGLVLSAVMVLGVLSLIQFGISGVAFAVLLGDVFGLIFNVLLTNKVLPGSATKTVRASVPSLVAALIMFGVVLVSRNFLVPAIGENVWSLTILVIIGILVYIPLIYVFQRDFTKEVGETLVKAVDKNGRIERFIAKRKPA